MSAKPVTITITGAGGQIGYALLFRIASGDLLARVSWLAESTLMSLLVRGGVRGGLVYDLTLWCPSM
jgi:malate/lactate dehydrogenase